MSPKIIFIILVAVIILYCILRFAFKKEESFFDSPATQGNYEALRRRLKTMMNSYCQLANYAQEQIKNAYKNPRPGNAPLPNPPPKPPSPPIKGNWTDPDYKPNPPPPSRNPTASSIPTIPGENDQQLVGRLQQTYNEVYNCSDALAVSRPACAAKADMLKELQKNDIDINAIKPPPSVPFVPCKIYLDLPAWPDKLNAAYMLSSIPDNLAERVIREIDWYNAIADTLLEAIEKGRNPPSSPPDNSSSPARDASGKPWSADGKPPQPNLSSRASTWKTRAEGFQAQCSPSAQQAVIERKRRAQLEAEAAAKAASGGAGGAGGGAGAGAGAGGPNPADNPDTCVMPDLDGQIARVNAILDSPALNQALRICDIVLIKLRKAQADLEKAKNGNLFEWQKDPPKKVVAPFKGGDRAAALTFSMRQNQI
jgi:hypothetical protein